MSAGFFGETKAKPKEVTAEEQHVADAYAEEVGFVSREPLRPPPKRRRGTRAQLHNFTMRLTLDDAEQFIRWCERERLAYREGFSRLMAMVDRA